MAHEDHVMTEEHLGIYRLIPTARSDDSGWDLAPSQGEVVVRARSAADARVVAAEAEGDFTEIDAKPGHGVRTNPASAFRDIRLYSVVEETDERLAQAGPRGIIAGRIDPVVLKPVKER
jgi:hypothetical protein